MAAKYEKEQTELLRSVSIVSEQAILHGTLDALQTGQHRFKLAFT